MEYIVAIPSYDRVDTIQKATLNTLETLGVPAEKINIFVADRKQKNLYKKALGDKYKLIIGKLGLNNQRNFITQYYKNGQYIVNLDDDVYEIQEYHEGSHRNLRPIKEINLFIKKAFEICVDAGAKMWGVYPINNYYFMKTLKPITENLTFIVGTFWGCINDRELQVQLSNKDDYERSIKSFLKQGKVIRFNHYTLKTKYYKEKGGLQTYGRSQEILENEVDLLLTDYPEYLTRKRTKKDTPEIMIKSKTIEYKPATTQELLVRELNNTKFGKNVDRPNVSGIDEEKSTDTRRVGKPCESITLGLFRLRGTKKDAPKVLTKLTHRKMELFELAKKYMNEIDPDFSFTTICINKNLVCKKHRDKYNASKSVIVGLGDYEGGNLYIEGEKHNIRYNPLVFDGTKEHWNDEITKGTKYSIIYFTL